MFIGSHDYYSWLSIGLVNETFIWEINKEDILNATNF